MKRLYCYALFGQLQSFLQFRHKAVDILANKCYIIELGKWVSSTRFTLVLQHNTDYVVSADSGGFFIFKLNYQPHVLHALFMLRSGRDDINSGRVYA